jgi:hypothetical protein
LPSPYQEELKSLVTGSLCKNTYYSIAGMAESQIAEGQKPKKPGAKGRRTAFRTLNFGIELLSSGRLCYEPVPYVPDLDAVLDKKRQLLEAYEASDLPRLPDDGLFREFLFRVRMDEMSEKICFDEGPGIIKGQENPY